jgi:hypothetical protein
MKKREYATCMAQSNGLARDEKKFLGARLRDACRIQPELRELRKILLGLGGGDVVPPAAHDPTINFLIDFGIVFSGPVLLKEGSPGRWNHSMAHIWSRRLHGIVGIGVGYALGDDNLWREHTFGVLREGVLETAAVMQKYFGLLLISQAADGFAETLLKDNGQDDAAALTSDF